jgi:3-dehydroquinate dehydratase type I
MGEAREVVNSPCQVVEVRGDLFPEGLSTALDAVELVAASGRRTVFTIRDSAEGGSYRGPVEKKVELLLKALDRGAWMIDVEYRFRRLEEVLASAASRTIVSLHEYRWPLSVELLYALVGDMVRIGASIAKIVMAIRRVEDNHRLLLLNAWKPGRVVAFGAGRKGMMSRVLAPVYGAPLTYAGFKRGAPGQPSYQEVMLIWKLLGLLS